MSELLDIWRQYYDARETSVTIFNIVGKLGNFENAKRPGASTTRYNNVTKHRRLCNDSQCYATPS